MARFRSPVLAIAVVVGVLAVGDSVWKVVWAVTACANPDSAGARNAWPALTTINVNLSNFPATLQPCAKSAFDN